MNETSGYIKIHREIQDHPMYFSEPFTRMQAWIDLILMAQYKDKKVYVRGNEVWLKKGEALASIPSLTRRWQRSNNTVIKFLKEFENKGMISRKLLHNKISVITICNWDKYQCNEIEDCTTDCTTDCTPIQEYKESKESKEKILQRQQRACAYVREGRGEGDAVVVASEQPPGHSTDTSHRRMADNLAGGGTMLESLMRIHATSQEELIRAESEFYDRQQAIGADTKDFADYRRHFNDWLRKKREYETDKAAADKTNSHYTHKTNPRHERSTEIAAADQFAYRP